MANRCFPMLRGRVFRFTRLDGCGEPVLGPDSVVVSDGVISLALTPVNVEGEAISLTNANGDPIASETPAPRFQNYTAVLTFGHVNPVAYNMLTNNPLVLDADDNPIGLRVSSDVNTQDVAVAVEWWSTVPQEQCVAGQTNYGYGLLPFLQGGTLGDLSIENAAVSFTITGASTKDNSNWGVGPHDVDLDETDLPGPLLTPIGAHDHLDLHVTAVAPPTASCDPIALGTLATGATAGTPGTWTPANSYGPLTLVELQASSIIASPATAWTTGQRVVLRDGSLAHWDSDSWEAGAAS